jgi:alanine racemase
VWTARHAARIAIVAAGYGDGYLRSASATDEAPGSDVVVAGKRCPLAGRVSMDLMAVDVSGLPDKAVRRGDLVTLIGDDVTLDDVGNKAGTIGYEILTSLGRRYHRVYRD